MKLSQGNVIIANTQDENFISSGLKKESRGAAASGSVEKLKASNFPASLLRIGSWEVYPRLLLHATSILGKKKFQ